MKFLSTIALLFVVISAFAQTYAVGHRTFTYADAARANRSVTGHIYYPATTTADNAAFATGKFPLVVFGHGFTIAWTEYDFFYQALAQNGYIVVMPTTEGGLSPNHANFGGDLKFLVTKMNAENAVSTSPYYQRLSGKNAVMGHSMGGGAAFLAAAGNTSVHTLVTFAAANTTPSAITAAATVTCPSITFGGSRDCVAAPATNAKAMYLGATTASYRAYIEIINGSHCQFGKASAFSRCNLAEGTACGSTAAGFVTIASQHQQMLNVTLPWLNYSLKASCAGYLSYNNYLITSTLHTYLRTGTTGSGCRFANVNLPVVTATTTGSSNLIKWTTIDESLFSNYTIQRSADGENFAEIGQISATGATEYQFSDAVNATTSYYRIVANDASGLNYFSPVAKVENSLDGMLAFPNPMTNDLNIVFNAAENGEATANICDIAGKILSTKTWSATQGINTTNFDISTFNTGVYLVKISINNQIFVKKLMK